MYTFLMADDEEIVRRGFRHKIDWAGLGFEFLEPCENGEQAIEALETFRPDVIMTDIAMPHVDGLGVAAYAAEHYPRTMVVILSGYDEFEYAQRAIKSNVFEYVLKPVTSRELAGLLQRLRVRLDERARERLQSQAVEQRAEAATELLQQQTLLELVTAPADSLSEQRFTEVFGFSPAGLRCCAVVGDGPAPAPARTEGPGDMSPRPVLRFSAGEGRHGVLVMDRDEASCERRAAVLARRMAEEPALIVGIGRPRDSWRRASESYREAVAALSARLAGPSGACFRYTQAAADDPRTLDEMAAGRERTRRSVLSGEADDATAQGTSLLARLGSAGISPQRVRHEVEALFASIIDGLGDLGIVPAAVERDLGVDFSLEVQRLRTSEEVLELLGRLAGYAGSVLAGRGIPAPEWKVRDFREYVARHFGERGLSVQSIAANLSISASYLSKLVKRHLDRSVVDYLVDFRMERAKELLATTDLLAYEVAEATGYPDAQYFSTVFKRHIGLTPSEFRARRKPRSPAP